MKYIIMCGGIYPHWSTPKQLQLIQNETILNRTIRLLRENGIEDIAISANDPVFDNIGLPILHHRNEWTAYGYNDYTGYWCEAFYPTDEPVCYIFGDVVFSPAAIKTIVNTDTDSIEFFASAPPFSRQFPKKSAEPFALKVVNQKYFRICIEECKNAANLGYFRRQPIMWELWQIIKRTPLNIIDYTNYKAINDYTSDIDSGKDIEYFQRIKL
jgi:hypothetical protein